MGDFGETRTNAAVAAPFWFRHALLAVAQTGILTLACAAVGVFTSEGTENEFFGHIGPSAMLMAIAALALTGPRDEARLVHLEGLVALLGGFGYLLGDTFYAHPPWGVFDGAGSAEQLHVALMTLIGAAGLFAVLHVRILGQPTVLHAVVVIAAFAMFMSGHHQHGEASVLAHTGAALFAVLAGIFRVLGRRVDFGVCVMLTAYIFFGGQKGFVAFTSNAGLDPAPWLGAWTVAGLIAAILYLATFTEVLRR